MAVTATPSSSVHPAYTISPSSDLSKVPIKRFVGHRDKVRAVAWNADGRRLASGSQDKTIRIWVPEKDSRTSTEMRGPTAEVSCIRWDPTHPEHLASCSAATGSSADKNVYFWDIRQGKPTSKVETDGETIQMTWSPDGKTIVVGSRYDVITWIDVESKKVIKRIKLKEEANEAIFSHTGNLLMSAVEGRISISAHPSDTPVYSVRVSPVSTTVLDLDPRGRYLAAGSNDATVTLWETKEWTCVRSMGYHDDPIRACRFSQDGFYLATTSTEPEIVIAEIPSGKKVYTIPTHGTCDSLAWHPTRNLLAYASDEIESDRRPSGAFRIWGL